MCNKRSNNAFPTPGHNHKQCLNDAIDKARKVFSLRKLRLTPLREQIYRQILTSHDAIGAYDILDRMRRQGREIAPITAYRILDLLHDMGLIHRLELQNAYYACYRDHEDDKNFIALICRGCGTIAELVDRKVSRVFEALEKEAGFTEEKRVLEVQGLCRSCRDSRKGGNSEKEPLNA